QALVDKKKVVVTEAVIREVVLLDDAEGVDYLPNEEIFTELARMGYEKPSIKLTFYKAFFSSHSAMAFAVICLSTGKGFSRVETSLFKGMLVGQEIEEGGDEEEHVKDRVDTSDDTMMDDESNQGRKIDEMDKDDVVALIDDKEEDKKDEEYKIAKVVKKVVTAASKIISTAEPQVPAATITAAPSKDKGKGILVEEPKPLKKQQIEMDKEYARKMHAELNKDIDWDVAIDHVKHKAKEDLAIKRYQAMKRKPQTEAQARKNMIMYLKNVVGFREDLEALFTSKPKCFSDDFLLTTLEAMFEKPDAHAQV
nr:hypothetical protein [Tanacetum cinerariifolium]